MHNKKVVYIPGWMDRSEYNGFPKGLDIWGSDINLKEKIDCDVVVAHSLGCRFAMLNWIENRNTKMILINPLLGNRNIFTATVDWIRFFFTEGIKYANNQRLKLFFKFFTKLKMTYDLVTLDFNALISKIPSENIVIIRGTCDHYLCDQKNIIALKEKGYSVVDVENMGHTYDKDKVQEVINELKF